MRFLNAEFSPRELRALLGPAAHALRRPERLANQAAAAASMLTLRTRVRGLPWAVQVEPSAACNLRCPMCASVLPDARRPALLDMALFSRLLADVGYRALILSLWNWGEPLLHPDLPAMVAAGAERGLLTALTTNGLLLDEERSEALIRAGLVLMTVSLDGADAATYQAVHGSDEFGRVTANLARFLAVRTRLGSRLPLVELKMVLTRDTENDMPAFHRLSRELGADRVRFRRLVWAHDANLERLAPQRAELRRPHGIVPSRFRVPCDRPWMSTVVLAGGEVVPCCADTKGEFVMGHLGDPGGLPALWNGPRYREFRRRLLTDPRGISICATCPAASFQGDTWDGPERLG